MKIICPKCRKISGNNQKCSFCGQPYRVFPIELVKHMEKVLPIIKGMKENLCGDELVPMAFLISETNIEPRLFVVKNDGVEEEIKKLAEEIVSMKNITAVILVSEMWIKRGELEGLSIVAFNKEAAFVDVIPFIQTKDRVEFGEIRRKDVTNNFDELGVLAVIYKHFIKRQEEHLSSVSPIAQHLIDATTDFVQKNRSKCPDLEGVPTEKVINELLLARAIRVFNSEEQELLRDYVCEIFLYLQKNNLLSGNMERVLCFFLGVMYKYGYLVEKNFLFAVENFRKCIGSSESKTGFVSYIEGEDFPIEMTIGSIDNFVSAAKIELGNMLF